MVQATQTHSAPSLGYFMLDADFPWRPTRRRSICAEASAPTGTGLLPPQWRPRSKRWASCNPCASVWGVACWGIWLSIAAAYAGTAPSPCPSRWAGNNSRSGSRISAISKGRWTRKLACAASRTWICGRWPFSCTTPVIRSMCSEIPRPTGRCRRIGLAPGRGDATAVRLRRSAVGRQRLLRQHQPLASFRPGLPAGPPANGARIGADERTNCSQYGVFQHRCVGL